MLGLILLGVGLGLTWLIKARKEEVQRIQEIPTPTLTTFREREGGEKKVRALMVVAPKDFRDEELFEPKKILEERGIEVKVASKGVSEASGMLGGKILIDKDLTEAKIEDYDGVVFVGGTGASIYFNDPEVQSLAKEAFEKGKVVGAICIAPSILANSGILAGKRATSFPSEAENLKSKGTNYTGGEVEIDGKIVTAQGPAEAKEFGQTLAWALLGGGD